MTMTVFNDHQWPLTPVSHRDIFRSCISDPICDRNALHGFVSISVHMSPYCLRQCCVTALSQMIVTEILFFLTDPWPQFKVHASVWSRISHKQCIFGTKLL